MKKKVVNMYPHPKNSHIRNGQLARLLIFVSQRRKHPLARLLTFLAGCEFGTPLPDSTFLPHPQGIVVGCRVFLGKNVVIGHQVTLGGRDLDINHMPAIHDGVYLGAGCKVLGKVIVGTGATVGANAVVTKDVPAGGVVVGANRILEGHLSPYA